jgi:uncharacterized protein (DUF2062 family)
MLEALSMQIGPPFMCAEFAGDCIDGVAVGIILIVIAASAVALLWYRKSRKQQTTST